MTTPAPLHRPYSLIIVLAQALLLVASPGSAHAAGVKKNPAGPLGPAQLFGVPPLYTEFVVNVSSRGQQIPTLVDVPGQQPLGAVILLAGGNGRLDLTPQGRITTELDQNYVVSTRTFYAIFGYIVMVPDLAPDFKVGASDVQLGYRGTQQYADDIGAMVTLLRAKLVATLISPPKRLPIVVIGTSKGSIGAADAVAKLQAPRRPDGAVLTSAFLSDQPNMRTVRSVANNNPALLAIPMLIGWNTNDMCPDTPPNQFSSFEQWYGNTLPPLSSHAFTGPPVPNADPCGATAPHGFEGIGGVVVQYTLDWIKNAFKSSLHP
jgi:hypothetical protein